MAAGPEAPLSKWLKEVKKPSQLVRWSNKKAIGLHELRIAALLCLPEQSPRTHFLTASFTEG